MILHRGSTSNLSVFRVLKMFGVLTGVLLMYHLTFIAGRAGPLVHEAFNILPTLYIRRTSDIRGPELGTPKTSTIDHI